MYTTIKRTLAFLSSGTLTVILAACYGPVMEDTRKVVKTVSPDGQPIEGLQVDLLNDTSVFETRYTDSTGCAEFFIYPGDPDSMKVAISDIDGTENGGPYKPTEFSLTDSNSYPIQMEL